jgi:hypothetical protein
VAKKPNEQLDGHTDIIDVVLLEKDGVQYRLSVSEFRESNYLSMREWYMDFDETWMPTRNGFTLPYNIATVATLYKGLNELLSKAEHLETLQRYLDEQQTEESAGDSE